MGTPYLNSGEAIVLTTNRVSVDAVQYDLMLTTERLFFIDNRNTRFEPRIIALSTILSVQGAKTPVHDPVITLLFRTGIGGDARQPLNLVFSQNRNENRKPERDDWVRSLIQLSISQHDREIVTETPIVPDIAGRTGLRPTARHGVAPEMVRPLSNVVDRERAPAPDTLIPDEVEAGEVIPDRVAAVMPLRDERPVPEPEKPSVYLTPLRGTPPFVPAPRARIIIPQIIEELLPEKKNPAPLVKLEQVPAPPALVIIPQIIEELLPEKKNPAPLVKLEPVPAAVYDPEVLFRAIPTAVRSMTITEERTPSPPPSAENVTVHESGLPVSADTEPRKIPDIIRALHSGSVEPIPIDHPETVPIDDVPEPVPRENPETGPPDDVPEPVPRENPETGPPDDVPEPVPTEHAETGPPDDVPEPVPDNSDAPVDEIPEVPVTLTSPETWEGEPVSFQAPDELVRREPSGAEDIPVRHPIPPAREIRPLKTTLVYAVVALFVIALVAAGAVLLFPQGSVQTNTVPPVTVLPATTRIATPVPSLPLSPVPQTGVWVRVTCTAEYFGTLGNTGMMRQVSGTGDNLYTILWSDRPVQISVQKKDNSGAKLTATIYRNGTQIATRSVTSPRGTVEILIDPLTARPPGLTADDTLPEHTAMPAGLENY